MKTKIKIISWSSCILLIVCLITLIIGVAIKNNIVIFISLFAALRIYVIGGLTLNFLNIIYKPQGKEKTLEENINE